MGELLGFALVELGSADEVDAALGDAALYEGVPLREFSLAPSRRAAEAATPAPSAGAGAAGDAYTTPPAGVGAAAAADAGSASAAASPSPAAVVSPSPSPSSPAPSPTRARAPPSVGLPPLPPVPGAAVSYRGYSGPTIAADAGAGMADIEVPGCGVDEDVPRDEWAYADATAAIVGPE